MKNWTVGQKGFLLVLIPAVFQLVILVATFVILKETRLQTLNEIHSRTVAEKFVSLSKFPDAIAESLRLFLLTGDVRTKNYCFRLISIAKSDCQNLKNMLADRDAIKSSGTSTVAIKNLEASLTNVCTAITSSLSDATTGNVDKAHADSISRGLHALRSSMTALEEEEKTRRGASPLEWAAQQAQLDQIGVGVLFLSFAASALLAWLILTHTITRRLSVVADNSRRLASNVPLLPPLSGSDEIAILDRDFRKMAKALTEAVDREKAVVENAMDVICTLDDAGKFRSVNASALNSWGYSEDELLGRRLLSILHEKDIESTNTAFATTLDGIETKPIENRIKRKDGSIAHTLWSIRSSSERSMLFCVVHDISERKEIERLKDDFVAMISHDLRTPLSTMQFTLTLAHQGVWGELSNNGKERIDKALRSATRLLDLINQLLVVQKLESGTMEIDSRECALSTIFSEATHSLSAFAEQHNVRLDVAPTDLSVYCDPDRIIQVVINLVANAIKFSAPGAVVNVAVEEIDNETEVRITDTGKGIPESHQAVIFERFKQVDRTDESEKKGTGLGLAICKLIVEAHGGTIGVNSAEGQGSTFWFRLPKSVSASTR